MMNLDQFIQEYTGQSLSYDGIKDNRGQCVQLVAYYVEQVLGCPPFFADAVYWFTTFGGELPNYFDKTDNNENVLPQRGDIVVWGSTLPNSGGAGHIAVCLSANQTQFTSFDSNWNGKYAHQVTHDWSYVIGWLRPKAKLANLKEEDMTTPRNLVVNYYNDLLGRPPTEDEITYWMPKAPDLVYDGIKGSKEYRTGVGTLKWLRDYKTNADSELQRLVTQLKGQESVDAQKMITDLQSVLDKYKK